MEKAVIELENFNDSKQPEAAFPTTTQTLMLATSLGLDLRAVPPQHSTPR